MSRTAGWVVIGVGALLMLAVGVFVFRLLSAPEPPLIIGPIDTLPDSTLLKQRPKPGKRTLPQRVLAHRVPARVTVSQGSPDTAAIGRFARAVHEADSLRELADSLRQRIAQGDQTINLNAVAQPKRLLPPVAGKYNGKDLTLWVTRSDGSLMRATARLKPRWEFYAGMDKASDTLAVFTSDRWFVRVVRQTAHCAPPAGIVAGVGAVVNPHDRVLGAVIGGAGVLFGCLIG